MCFLKVLEYVREISYTALYQISALFMLVSKQYINDMLVSLMHIDINIYKSTTNGIKVFFESINETFRYIVTEDILFFIACWLVKHTFTC